MRTARRAPDITQSGKFDVSKSWPVVLLAGVALLFGGGGSRYATQNLAVEVLALGLVLFCVPSLRSRVLQLPRALRWLVLLTVLVPVSQIIPLPPFVWQDLPGSELALESRKLIGADNGWYPLSVFPLRTAAAASALVVPIAMLLLADRQRIDTQLIFRIILAIGAANLLAGAMQILSGQNWIMPYPILERGRLYGFFANHNSSGLLFVLSSCALLGIEMDRKASSAKWLGYVLVAFAFFVGAVLTQSRSSTALSLFPLVLHVTRAYAGLRRKGGRTKTSSGRGKSLFVLVGTLIGGLVAMIYFFSRTSLQNTLLRFDNLEDSRPDIWADSLYSIERFWPLGSGMGTFNEVFQLDESLETLLPSLAGRAHNEYLEIGVEAGILAWALLFAWAVWAAIASWKMWRESARLSNLAIPLAIVVILLQSAVDYPLRNLALLCLVGLLIAVLAGQSQKSKGPNS